MTKSVGQIEKDITRLPNQAFNEWKKVTPEDTGNAKRKTRLKKNAKGGTIHARYPYAQRLDNGWSRQAPKGMYEPVLEFLRRTLSRRFRRK
jgi:hypothetical protein